MRRFLTFIFLLILGICTHIPVFAQTGFTGVFQNMDAITIAEGSVLYIDGELKTNTVIFNGGEIFVSKDVTNTSSITAVYPNSVGTTILNGNTDQNILGNWHFNELRIDKQAGNVKLTQDIEVDSSLTFTQGNLYIYDFTVDLKNEGFLTNESNENRIYADNGMVTTTRQIQFPIKTIDIAGLGIFIEAPLQSFGTTTISRGHTVFTDAGSGSIARYFDITTNNQLPIDNIKLRYFETDNISNEPLLQLYSYKTSLPVWFPRGGIVDETADTIVSPYYRNLGTERITLAPASDNATCSHNDPNYVEAIYLVSTRAYTLDSLYFINFSTSNNEAIAMSYIWNFGDGGSADAEDTFHIYQTAGIYATSLQVSNGLCSDIRRKYDTITVAPPARAIGLVYGEILSSFKYYPNPCSGSLTIDAELSDEFPSAIIVFDVHGRKLFENKYTAKTFSDQLPMQEFASGMYVMELQAMGKRYTYKIIKD